MFLEPQVLISKVKSLIKKESPLWDPYFLLKAKKVLPHSFEFMGDGFFKSEFNNFFKEIPYNFSDLKENFNYLAPYFKKKYQNTEPALVELIDFEICTFQLNSQEAFQYKKIQPRYGQLYYLSLNPLSLTLTMNYDVLEFTKAKKKTILEPELMPHLLLITKNPENQKIQFLKGQVYHAAILDLLKEGSYLAKDIISELQIKFPKVSQRDWIVALKELKENFIVLEFENLISKK